MNETSSELQSSSVTNGVKLLPHTTKRKTDLKSEHLKPFPCSVIFNKICDIQEVQIISWILCINLLFCQCVAFDYYDSSSIFFFIDAQLIRFCFAPLFSEQRIWHESLQVLDYGFCIRNRNFCLCLIYF